ncbi:MAG: hypothetical protein ACRC0G_07525 [Fusobacteriaceae bacterium]
MISAMNRFKNINKKDVVSVTDKMVDDYLGEILYLIKTLVYKDEKLANENETLDSKKKSDFYIMALEGTDNFYVHNYPRWMLEYVGVPIDIQDECMIDKNLIPDKYRTALLELKRKGILESYVEENPYYRMLKGIPGIKDVPIYVMDTTPGIPSDKPIHEFDKLQIEVITNNGTLDRYRSMYPEAKYLNYLGDKSIDYYASRTAPGFGLLYISTSDESMYNKFYTTYNKVRQMVLHTLYNPAFENQKFYDSFIAMLMGVLTNNQMLVDYVNVGVKRDFNDSSAINFIFQSYGVDTFEDLPLVYRKKVMKNLIPLLKYKGTDTIIKEVYKLFGVGEIDVSKYYLIKTHRLDQSGQFIFETLDQNTPSGIVKVPDFDKMYDVGFVKVKMEEKNVDNAIKNSPIENYMSVVGGDRYWGGDDTDEAVKMKLLKENFNYTESKYIGINNTYNLTEILFELNYFFKSLVDLKPNYSDSVSITIPSISTIYKVDLFDACMILFALISEKYGSAGDIPHDVTVNAKILGFNFESDIDALNQFIMNNGFDPNKVHRGGLKYPEGFINTPAQIIDLFFQNRAIYNHISGVLENTEDYNEYRVYRKVFDTLMISENNMEIYKKADGSIASSYMDLLSDKPLVYNFLHDVFQIEESEKISTMNFLVTEILQSLSLYIESDKFKFLFMNIPSLTGSLFRKYIQRVIDFFKSYTVEIITVSNMYVFEERADNTLRLLDTKVLARPKKIHAIDQMYRDCFDTVTNKKSKTKMLDIIEFSDMLTIYYNYKGGQTNVE